MSDLHILDHPLIQSKLTRLRDVSTLRLILLRSRGRPFNYQVIQFRRALRS